MYHIGLAQKLEKGYSVIQSPHEAGGGEGSEELQINTIDSVVGVDNIKGDKKQNVLDVKINSSKGSFSDEGRIITVEFDRFYLSTATLRTPLSDG